jgi:hypothetical protein
MNRTFWLVLTILWITAGVVSAFLALTSIFMFDSPGSESSPLTIALFVCMIVLPAFWFAGVGAAWVFRSKVFGKWLFLVPLADLAAIGIVMGAIGQFCNGSFACR